VAQPDGISRGENEYTLACLTEIIPAVRIEKLKAMIAELGVTLNCVVQCAWAILLGHHGVSDDVVFGSVVSGRPTNLPGVADIVGLFLNTVPLRIRLDNDQEITGMLKTIQARALESEPYHYVCLADIQTATRFGSDLLNNVLIFENYPLSQEMMELSKQVDTGFTLGQVEEFERTNYDLALEVYPGDTLTLNFKYNAAVYTSDQMNGYQQELSDLLAVMSQSLEQPLGMVRAVLMDASQIDEKETFLTGIEAIDEDF
jgi:non-ribosomal peptide synthetase component F